MSQNDFVQQPLFCNKKVKKSKVLFDFLTFSVIMGL